MGRGAHKVAPGGRFAAMGGGVVGCAAVGGAPVVVAVIVVGGDAEDAHFFANELVLELLTENRTFKLS